MWRVALRTLSKQQRQALIVCLQKNTHFYAMIVDCEKPKNRVELVTRPVVTAEEGVLGDIATRPEPSTPQFY